MRHAKTVAMAVVAGAMLVGQSAPVHAQAPDTRPTVAVMHFNNGAIGKWHEEYDALRVGIADLLLTELAANDAIRVVERDQLAQLMREQDLGAGGRVDKETAVRVGRLLGAKHMIFGGFVIDARGTLRIDVRAVNTETSQIEYVETVQDKSDNFVLAVSRLAERINAGMKLPAVSQDVRDARHEQAKEVPFKAALLYSRAVAEESNGEPERAVERYRALLAEFPDYEPAQRALARVKPGA